MSCFIRGQVHALIKVNALYGSKLPRQGSIIMLIDLLKKKCHGAEIVLKQFDFSAATDKQTFFLNYCTV